MLAWARLFARKSSNTVDEPAIQQAGGGASESHDAITVASMPARRTFGVTITGRRLPAPVRAARTEETRHEYDEEVLARPTRGVRCRDAHEPTGSHADRATKRGTRCGDTSMHCRGTSAITGAGRGPVAGHAACGRVQGLHGCSRLSAVKTARVCNRAIRRGVVLLLIPYQR